VKFGKPTPQSIRKFLTNGINKMKSAETRESLKDRGISKPGLILIEMQRSEWDPLGFDRDIGCNALDTLEQDHPSEKELCKLKLEFMHTASRTFLQSLVDRQPDKLIRKGKVPRQTFIDFFEACNTQCGVPEFQDKLSRQKQNKPANEGMIEMQRNMLEIIGVEREYGCQMLSRIPRDFPQDQELHQMFHYWQVIATNTCRNLMTLEQREQLDRKAEQAKKDRLDQMREQSRKQMAETIKEMSKGNASLLEEAKNQIKGINASERQELVDGMMKKMKIFQDLPNDARLKYMTTMKEDDKREMVKLLLVLSDTVSESPKEKLNDEAQTTTTETTPAQSETPTPPKEAPPAPPQQLMM
jgi:hypothetical protein